MKHLCFIIAGRLMLIQRNKAFAGSNSEDKATSRIKTQEGHVRAHFYDNIYIARLVLAFLMSVQNNGFSMTVTAILRINPFHPCLTRTSARQWTYCMKNTHTHRHTTNHTHTHNSKQASNQTSEYNDTNSSVCHLLS
jgi:hypothetical protein